MEIQRAVAAAEARTLEMIAQERLKMEKMYADIHRGSSVPDETEPPITTGSQNVMCSSWISRNISHARDVTTTD